jgi:hypothetical protein
MNPKTTAAVVTVGDGRGFVVAGERRDKVVITSAHCLPHLPPAHGAADLEEKTYGNLLGRLGETPTVWVECLFVNPVSDIAVLGSPDNQALGNEADAYEELFEPIKPLAISDTKEKGRAWLFSLECQWFSCAYEVFNGGPLWLSCKKEENVAACPARPSCWESERLSES